MKKCFVFIFFLSGFCNLYSQNYDLIVTTESDSIACHIDSISSESFYFEMKIQHRWIHTHLEKSKVSAYKFDALSKKSANFKTGTSYLESESQTPTTWKTYKNSVYLENLVDGPSISYDRFISTGGKTGIVVKAGFLYSFWGSGFAFVAESSFLVGKNKNYFEAGIGWGGKDILGLFGRAGYRYRGNKGLLLKGGILIVKNVPVFPAFGIGFSF